MTPASEPFSRHDECTVFVAEFPEEVFAFADDHSKFSAHMSASSWMMLGSKMTTSTDAERGQEVGSHITMTGAVLGIRISLDEVVVERIPPWEKAWETVGVPQLLVIGVRPASFAGSRSTHTATAADKPRATALRQRGVVAQYEPRSGLR